MSIRVVLLNSKKLYSASLEKGKEISFGSSKKDDILVDQFGELSFSVSYKKNVIKVHAKKAYGIDKEIEINNMLVLDKDNRTVLFVTQEYEDKSVEIKLPYNGVMKFGRNSCNDVEIKFPFVSGEHFQIRNEGGITRVEDLGSTNGVYLNNKKIDVARMKSGDVLSIMSITIRLLNGVIHIDNVGDNVKLNSISNNDLKIAENHSDNLLLKLEYKRSPRAQEKLPSEDIILASAPNKAQKYEKNRGMISSLAGSSAMLATSVITGVASPALLAARSASMISPIISASSASSNSKKRKQQLEKYEEMRQKKYGAYIIDQKARINKVADLQREIILRDNPSVAECFEIVTGLKRKLWERSNNDRDFLDVRVGMGYEDLCVSVKARNDQSGFEMEDDEVKALTDQIIEETRIVDNVPFRISLAKYNSIGIVGKRDRVISLVKNMLISLCTTHCYEDVKIVGVFDKEEQSEWEDIKWIPHFQEESTQQRMLAFDKERAHDICDSFLEMIKNRVNDSAMTDRKLKNNSPHYVFIWGSKKMVEQEEIMDNLFWENQSVGFTSLFLFDDIYELPHKCRYIVDTENGPCGFDNLEVNNKRFYTPDKELSKEQFTTFTRRMAAIELIGLSKSVGMPDKLTFLNGFGVSKVEELNVEERWRKSQPYDTLAAQIGVMNGGKTFSLDIHEKNHGPHGLVAGTTGSGKSELLQTWILSMALNYHPHDVVFVLIDYKGGGMANLLEPLPHVVGKITNIGSNIGRSLISLQSEIKRRQRIFDDAGVNHIDKYQKKYHKGEAKEPLPHLIIVADEFAELKKEEPEFMAGLISASRVGRSLGIHLILATQKPGGIVDDQIQSNSRFRLCLKVQDVNDSREMIKRPDAARLTRPGRAYVRVGEDEYFDVFQSYWSGAEYVEKTHEDTKEEVKLVDTYGNRISLTNKTNLPKSDIDELSAVVQYITNISDRLNLKKLQGPWLPELPDKISLENLFDESDDVQWPIIPIGKFDNPKCQSQGVQYIDFSEQGHYAIYGTSGTGKTTLLKTILLSICQLYKPEEISVYVIDAGGWSLSSFADMPNVGGVVLDGEEEKIVKLAKLIMSEFEKRKKIFLENSVSSLRAYRRDISNNLPAIVIAVDNIVPLFEMYPDIENFFINIARDGATYGIYLLYSANSTSGVRYKVVQNTRGAIAFELADKGDYPSIVGRPEGKLSKNVGRALIKGNPPVEFQVALPYFGDSDKMVNEKIKSKASELNKAWNGYRPDIIPVMGEKIKISDMFKQTGKISMIPIGMSYENIAPVVVDLSEKYSMLVTGPIKSGKSKFLSQTSQEMYKKNNDLMIVAFDSGTNGLFDIKNICFKYALDLDNDMVSDVMKELVSILNKRKNDEKLGAKANEFQPILILIDDLRHFVDSISVDNKNTMERISRMAGGLGVMIIAAGRMSDMQKYSEIESLTRVIISNQNGFVTSGKPEQYLFFSNQLKYTEKSTEAGEGNGYVFVNGECIKIKKVNE